MRGAAKVDRVGQTGLAGGAPKWQASLALSYARGPLSLIAQERFISHGVYDATYITGVDIDDNSISSAAYTNLRVSYDISPADTDMTIYANVTNLFNEDPPLVGSWSLHRLERDQRIAVRRAGPALQRWREDELLIQRGPLYQRGPSAPEGLRPSG